MSYPVAKTKGTPRAQSASATGKTKQRHASRDENLGHLPHEELVIEPESTTVRLRR